MEDSNREENTLRKRKWYRKKTRDENYRRPQDDGGPNSDSSSPGASPEVPPKRAEYDGSNEDSLSSDQESNRGNPSETISNEDSTSHASGSDGNNYVAEAEEQDSDNEDQNNLNNSMLGAGLENEGQSSEEVSSREDQGNEVMDELHDHDQDDLGEDGNIDQLRENANINFGHEEVEANEEPSGEETESHSGVSSDQSSTEDEEEEDEEEEDEEEEEENEAINIRLRMPVYGGATISLQESLLAILTFALTHRLTGLCISGLLSLIALHCGPDNLLMKSLYKFKTYFKIIGKGFIKCHYFCSVCQEPLDKKDSVCTRDRSHKNSEYFIEFPILSQLQSMFTRPAFYESLQFRFNRVKREDANIEDIYDGEIYQRSFNSGFLSNPNNLSFFMYFDGISLFKSSTFSIWPVYFTINELKYKLRTKKENTILAGLWFGKTKPNPNLFLRPLRESLSHWENTGEVLNLPNGQNVRVHAKLLGAVGDLPAKSLFMRFMQYNGAFSCFNCMERGTRFDVGNNTIQVLPYSRNFELRTIEDTNDYAAQALHARQNDPEASVYGVKGPSLLSAMLPDMISCMGIDVMHGVFLGVMRTLLTLWFDSQYSTLPFSISGLVHLVDLRLKNIRPPSTFVRIPRSIKKDFKVMKASDLKIFFFYYSLPVLIGILPERYWFHHCELVTAISLLCQESVSLAEIDMAEDMLHSYIATFQDLYGVRFMTLNFHQLLHLPKVTRSLGPAWVFSCFFYESLNGDLSRLVHGSRYVALQICSSSSIFMRLPYMISSMDEGETKALCIKFQEHKKQHNFKITENINNNTGIVGKLKPCYPVPQFLRRLFVDNFNIVGGRFKYFSRLKKRGTLYTSETYLRCKQRLSCFVEISHENTAYLCKINSFVKWTPCNDLCPAVCEDCVKRYFLIASLYDRELWELHDAALNIVMPYLSKVVPTNQVRVFSVDSLKNVCLYMSVDGNEYLSGPVNTLEIE